MLVWVLAYSARKLDSIVRQVVERDALTRFLPAPPGRSLEPAQRIVGINDAADGRRRASRRGWGGILVFCAGIGRNRWWR
jgi:hypothetical protein